MRFHLRRIFAALAAGLLALAAAGAEAPASPGTPASDTVVADALQKSLRGDPLFQNQRTTVDVHQGLAIIHGAATNDRIVQLINDKIKATPGIIAVYNYMTTPAQPDPVPGSVNVTWDDFNRIRQAGEKNNAFLLAQRVKDRLEADDRLQNLDISADSYRGLIILHGTVPDSATAQLVKNVAAHTTGVESVASYLTVSSLPEMPPAAAAPVRVQPAVTEPLPASSENCGCE